MLIDMSFKIILKSSIRLDLFPPLKTGKNFSAFHCMGNYLVCMLLLIRIAIIGLRLFTASLKILGPSNPAAIDGPKAFIYDIIYFIYDCACSRMEYQSRHQRESCHL